MSEDELCERHNIYHPSYEYCADCASDAAVDAKAEFERGKLEGAKERDAEWEAREAAVCDEDFSFEETIAALRKENGRLRIRLERQAQAKLDGAREQHEKEMELSCGDCAAGLPLKREDGMWWHSNDVPCGVSDAVHDAWAKEHKE